MNTSLTSATGAPSVGRQSKLVLFAALAFFAMGIVQLMDCGPLWLLWCSVSTLSMVGVLGLARLMLVPQFSTPWSVLAVSLSLGYGLGTFNTMASGYVDGLNLLAVTYAGHEEIARAIGALLVLVSIMLCIGEFDPNKLVPSEPLSPADQNSAFLVLLFTVAATVLAVATGALGFQSSMAAEEGSARVSTLGAVVFVSMAPMVATAVYVFAADQGSRLRWLVFLLCLVLLGVLMLQGRRIFMYSMLVSVIAFFAARGTQKFFTVKTFLLLGVVAAVVLTTSKFYFALRMASWSQQGSDGLMELLTRGLDIFMNAGQEGLNERVAENQSTRTFIIGYLAELVAGHEGHAPVGGGLLELGLATAVPTIIWPGKWRVLMVGSEEAICHPAFGLPGWDAANTIVTGGLCDFGWLGFFLYPMALAGFFSLVVYALRYFNPVPRMLVCFGITYGLFGVENAIASYFVLLRNVLILGALASVLVLVGAWWQRQIELKRQPLGGLPDRPHGPSARKGAVP